MDIQGIMKTEEERRAFVAELESMLPENLRLKMLEMNAECGVAASIYNSKGLAEIGSKYVLNPEWE